MASIEWHAVVRHGVVRIPVRINMAENGWYAVIAEDNAEGGSGETLDLAFRHFLDAYKQRKKHR